VYRTIELVDNQEERIIKNQLHFNVMDGAMIVGSMHCMDIFYLGRLLGPGGAPTKRLSSLNSSSGSLEKAKESGPQQIIDERFKG
jgi:hypothetical protein